MSLATEVLTKIEQRLVSRKNVSFERKQALIEQSNSIITNQFLERNSIKTKMCKNSQIKLEKFITKKRYTLISGPNEHSIAKFETTDESGNTITKEERLCFNDKCNYAHREEDLRKPLCIYNRFNCCTNRKCENDHSDKDLPRTLNLGSKTYKDENGIDIFKIFYYLNSIRIFDYSNKVTSVVAIKDDVFVETSINTPELIETIKDNFYTVVKNNWYPFSNEVKSTFEKDDIIDFVDFESFVSSIMSFTMKDVILNEFKIDETLFQSFIKFNELQSTLETHFLTKNNTVNDFVKYYNILDFALNTEIIDSLNLILVNYNLLPTYYNNFYIFYFSIVSLKILSINRERKVMDDKSFVSVEKDKNELKYFNLDEFLFCNIYELNCTCYPDIMTVFNTSFNSFYQVEFPNDLDVYTSVLKEVGSLPIYEIIKFDKDFDLRISYFEDCVKHYVNYFKNININSNINKKYSNVDEISSRSESPLLKEFNINNQTLLVQNNYNLISN